MQMSSEIQAKVAMWRRKSIEGTLSPEEMREAVDLLRAGRTSAAMTAAAAKKRTKAAKAIVSADDLLDELGGL
jgi:hypothetical protein